VENNVKARKQAEKVAQKKANKVKEKIVNKEKQPTSNKMKAGDQKILSRGALDDDQTDDPPSPNIPPGEAIVNEGGIANDCDPEDDCRDDFQGITNDTLVPSNAEVRSDKVSVETSHIDNQLRMSIVSDLCSSYSNLLQYLIAI
jgi:hypothetical protein